MPCLRQGLEGRPGRCEAMERGGAEPWKARFLRGRFLSLSKEANLQKAARLTLKIKKIME